MKLEIQIINRFKGIIPDDRRVYTYHSRVGAMGYSKEGYLHWFIIKSPQGLSALDNIGRFNSYLDSNFNKTDDYQKAEYSLFYNRTLSQGTSGSNYAHEDDKSFKGMSWFSFLEMKPELTQYLVFHWVKKYNESQWS